jgi:putative methionine-R-sulfoxide reductase with GAF domain
MSTRALEALDLILDRSEDADDALRDAVRMLAEEPSITWAGIAFLESGELALGPSAGTPDEARRHRVPITYQGTLVGELQIDGEVDEAFLSRVALLLSAHVLIGWDTAGEAWKP